MTTPFTIAVALSLQAATNYVYVTPAATNICGVGMGERPDYRTPRTEDWDYLREAYAERAWVGAALSGYTPAFAPPAGGADTNAVPSRHKLGDLNLVYYRGFGDGSYREPGVGYWRGLSVGYDSPTVAALTAVTNVTLYADPDPAIAAVFGARGPRAERTFGRLFDADGNVRTVLFAGAALTNAYHDLVANDALTFRQLLRQKDGTATAVNVTDRYENWPKMVDADGRVTWASRDDRRSADTNEVAYAEAMATFSYTVRVTKQGFALFRDGVKYGGANGVETYVNETAVTPLTTMAVAFPRLRGAAEVVGVKAFAVVTLNHMAEVAGATRYARSWTLVAPAAAGAPYEAGVDAAETGEAADVAVDVAVDVRALYGAACAATGETVALPQEVAGWVAAPQQPTATTWSRGYVIGRGQEISGRDQLTCTVRWIVGVAKVKFNAREEDEEE